MRQQTVDKGNGIITSGAEMRGLSTDLVGKQVIGGKALDTPEFHVFQAKSGTKLSLLPASNVIFYGGGYGQIFLVRD